MIQRPTRRRALPFILSSSRPLGLSLHPTSFPTLHTSNYTTFGSQDSIAPVLTATYSAAAFRAGSYCFVRTPTGKSQIWRSPVRIALPRRSCSLRATPPRSLHLSPTTMGRTEEASAEALSAVGGPAATWPANTAPSGRSGPVETRTPSPRRARLPGPARFTLAVVLSFALSSLGRSFVDYATQNEMSSIAVEASSKPELYALAAWKLYVTAGAQSYPIRLGLQPRAEASRLISFGSTKLTLAGVADSG